MRSSALSKLVCFLVQGLGAVLVSAAVGGFSLGAQAIEWTFNAADMLFSKTPTGRAYSAGSLGPPNCSVCLLLAGAIPYFMFSCLIGMTYLLLSRAPACHVSDECIDNNHHGVQDARRWAC